MGSDLSAILSLEVPLIVVLGERQLRLSEVTALAPGAIIELPKKAEEELTLLVNNKPVGSGVAVKVGENFGLRITYIGDLKSRIEAMGDDKGPSDADADAEALAEAMLAGQV
jgi:flagellar motor switch protein FliN/FliY